MQELAYSATDYAMPQWACNVLQMHSQGKPMPKMWQQAIGLQKFVYGTTDVEPNCEVLELPVVYAQDAIRGLP